MTRNDPLDTLDDATAAAAFRHLVRHLRHRHDAQNIDLMGLAGFCRNCLADWIREAGYDGDKNAARELIHGMPAGEWKEKYQTDATPEQLARMEESLTKNPGLNAAKRHIHRLSTSRKPELPLSARQPIHVPDCRRPCRWPMPRRPMTACAC